MTFEEELPGKIKGMSFEEAKDVFLPYLNIGAADCDLDKYVICLDILAQKVRREESSFREKMLEEVESMSFEDAKNVFTPYLDIKAEDCDLDKYIVCLDILAQKVFSSL